MITPSTSKVIFTVISNRYGSVAGAGVIVGIFKYKFSRLHEKIGLVLAKLDELKLTEKTIVIFQSDHGHSTEERAFWGGGNAGELRGAKGC